MDDIYGINLAITNNLLDNKVLQMKKLFTRKMKRIITWTIFIIFSFVLFVNNATNLLEKYSVAYNINLISWIGIIGSLFYTMWMKIYNR